MGTLKLKLVKQVLNVELECVDGSIKSYQLRELSGRARDKYLSAINKAMKYNDEGKPIGLASFDGLQTNLLALCLFDEEDKNVPADEITNWPASTVTALFDAAQKMNGLDAEAQEEVKNG